MNGDVATNAAGSANISSRQEDPVYTRQDVNRELERAVSALDDAMFMARYVPCGELLIDESDIEDIKSELEVLTNRSQGFKEDDEDDEDNEE